MNLSIPEMPPAASSGPAVWPLVIKDMCDRHQAGCAKYGTPLQAHNGRRPMVDAYQELLDLVVYLRQELEEREHLQAEVVRLRAQVELLRLQLGAVGAGSNARSAATLMPNIAECEDEWLPLPDQPDEPIEHEQPLDGRQIDRQLRAAHQGAGATIPTTEEMGYIDDPELEQRVADLGFIVRTRSDQAVDGVTT